MYNLFALALVLAVNIRYTVIMSPKKDETAIHGYNPASAVRVVLVSRKVNLYCVVSASLAVIFVFHFLSADKIFSVST